MKIRNNRNYYNITNIKKLRSTNCDIFEEEEEDEDEDSDDEYFQEEEQEEEKVKKPKKIKRKQGRVFYIQTNSARQYVKGKDIDKIDDEGLKVLNENIKTKSKPTKIFLRDPKKRFTKENKNRIKYVDKDKYQEIYLNVDFLSMKSNLELAIELNKKYLDAVIKEVKEGQIKEEMEKIKFMEKIKIQLTELKNFKNMVNPEFLSSIIDNASNVDFLKVGVYLEENYMEKIQNKLLENSRSRY